MNRNFGIVPGGGILFVYKFAPDDFGVIGATAMKNIAQAPLKLHRKQSFKSVEAMMRTFKLIKPDEEVQSVSIGCDRLGAEQLVVVTMAKGGPE